MVTIYTIGFTKKTLEGFIKILQENKITKIIDIRLNRYSQLAGFAKEKDLKYILEQFKIKYKVLPELAPDKGLLDSYHENKEWQVYEKKFNALISKRNIEQFKDEILDPKENVCFLCAEETAEKCHRRLIAEFFSKLDKNIKIEHL